MMSKFDEGGMMLPEICWNLMSESGFDEGYGEMCLRDGIYGGEIACSYR